MPDIKRKRAISGKHITCIVLVLVIILGSLFNNIFRVEATEGEDTNLLSDIVMNIEVSHSQDGTTEFYNGEAVKIDISIQCISIVVGNTYSEEMPVGSVIIQNNCSYAYFTNIDDNEIAVTADGIEVGKAKYNITSHTIDITFSKILENTETAELSLGAELLLDENNNDGNRDENSVAVPIADFEDLNTKSISGRNVGLNITDKLLFENIKLEVKKGGIWTEIDSSNLANIFSNSSSTGEYKFSIDWKTISADQQFVTGDFFKFTVPKEFGNTTITMNGPNGPWGTIVIEASGEGKATFNEGIVNKQEISGSIIFAGLFSESQKGVPVEWKFVFDKEYVYAGTSAGPAATNDAIKIPSDMSKSGTHITNAGGDDYFRWNIVLNGGEKTEGFKGKVKITDTFGGGYKMIPAGIVSPGSITPPQSINTDKGYHGAINAETTKAYFWIVEVDYNAMRKYYNENLLGTTLPSGTYAAEIIPEGSYSDYFTSYLVWEKYGNNDTRPLGKNVGDYKYMHSYIGEVTATLTSDGFTLEFPEDALIGKCLRIYYWTELTTMLPPEKITNSVKAETGDKAYSEKISDITITASASATGTAGSLILYKQDSNEQRTFSDVEFTLEKTNPSYSKKVKTDTDGKLEFKLVSPYAGTYTLTENPETTPEGYECAAPITLTLDADGKITHVNSTPVSSNGLTISDVCRIDKDGLIMIVYNKKIPMGGIKVTKVDSKDSATTLPGAKFLLYYIDDIEQEKYYYPATGQDWTSDMEAVKAFETDVLGEILVTNLPYRTYYLEEITAPVEYLLDGTPIEVLINTESVFNIRVKNTLDIPESSITIIKVDNSDEHKPLAGAIFSIEQKVYYEDVDTVPADVPTDSDLDGTFYWQSINAGDDSVSGEEGEVNFTKLLYGVYRITETQAPIGFVLLKDPIIVAIDKDGASYAIGTEDSITIPRDAEDGSYKLMVINNPAYTLPETGGIGIGNIYSIGIGIVLLAVFMLYIYRVNMKEKKRREGEIL